MQLSYSIEYAYFYRYKSVKTPRINSSYGSLSDFSIQGSPLIDELLLAWMSSELKSGLETLRMLNIVINKFNVNLEI